MPMNEYDWLDKWVHTPIITNTVTTKPKFEPKFKVGDKVLQSVFEQMPKQGVVVKLKKYGWVDVEIKGTIFEFLPEELTLVPSHKEFTDEEYEALLV